MRPLLTPRTADHEIDVPTAAARAHQPFLPIEKRQVGTIASDLFGYIGLDPMPARLAPDDQVEIRLQGATERCRPAGGLVVSPLDRHTGDRRCCAGPKARALCAEQVRSSIGQRKRRR